MLLNHSIKVESPEEQRIASVFLRHGVEKLEQRRTLIDESWMSRTMASMDESKS